MRHDASLSYLPMYRSYSHHSLLDDRRILIIRKYKMRTALFLVSVGACILVVLTLTSASPVSTEATTESSSPATTDSLAGPRPSVGYLNGSKLVITNVIKTLEFDVALEEEDTSENGTDTSTQFIETDIEVLNPQLLNKVVHELESTQESIDGTKTEENEDS